MGALLSLPLLAIPSAGTLITLATSCCGAATCSAVCSACGKFQNSMATRIAYAFILLLNSIVSWIMLTPWALKKLQHLTLDYMTIRCGDKECHGWVAVHRINFGLGLFHLILAVFLLGVRSSKDGRAVLQNGFWGPKVVLWLALVVVSFFIPQTFFIVYGNYIAFFCAMLFLLLGLILLVDLAHSWAEVCLQKIEDSDSRLWRGLLIGSTIGMYIASIAMTVLMYVFFADSGCAMNQAAITVNLVVFLIISFVSIQPIVQESNPRAGLAQAAMVTVYCTYLTMSAVSMEPDDRKCNPLVRARGTRTASIVVGALLTMATIAYTTTRAATQGLALGSKGSHNYSPLGTDDNEHGLVTQQPTTRREMRAEAIRAAVASGSLPASALDESDDESDDYDTKDDERGSTQYNYSLFHVIFFLATTWVATLLTANLETEGDATATDGFAPVGRSYWASWVHQIQSGQVIVDLCSVAKELVENSLDASATSIEVRFKNNGLDLIEVQDNGSGISPENYENLALKHYTSKLSSYEDLSRLQTFGFRGEALSSLCALSDFHVVTAQANQAPKAIRLDFEASGKLKKTQIVAGQKGTTVSVEGLFKRLPVRRRELEKNIKREYGKVLNLLHAYACISTGVRFSVKNTVAKTRNVVVFSTNGNQTTKENIANVYGAKTLLALIPLELNLEFEPSVAGRRASTEDERESNKLCVRGHVSKPVFGEGRQTPDRQMFFVNSRPCGLPQIAKAFNEVYKSFNVSQSPFVFADFHMDTNAYDVNVSPDKRTILLHDAGALIESLKTSLMQLFESSDQTVPQSQVSNIKQSTSKPQSAKLPSILSRMSSSGGADVAADEESEPDEKQVDDESRLISQNRMRSLLSGLGSSPGGGAGISSSSCRGREPAREPTSLPPHPSIMSRPEPVEEDDQLFVSDNSVPTRAPSQGADEGVPSGRPVDGDSHIRDNNNTSQSSAPPHSQQPITGRRQSPMETPNTIQNAFDRMRPRRAPAEIATITIGNRTVTSMVGSGAYKKRDIGLVDTTSPSTRKRRIHTPSRPNIFGQHMRDFAAPGSRVEHNASSEADEMEEEDETMDEEEEIDYDESVTGSQAYNPSDQDSIHSHDEDLPDDGVKDGPAMTQRIVAPAENTLNDEEKKKHEEAEVQRLIREAEEKAVLPQESNVNRANKLNKGPTHRDSTVHLVSTIDGSLQKIQHQMDKLQESLRLHSSGVAHSQNDAEAGDTQETVEERLSLTVSKDDFDKMRIAGQFNLGFIIATRSSAGVSDDASSHSKDELFIIDQHASDEKFNFERLQAETVVQNQRLVQPKQLDLTAIEEEIVIENQTALEKNGFIVEIDDSGNEPIGRRCKLVSLPLSKEIVFGVRDLEELIVLLSEMPANSATENMYVPRPSKVRKMFAMRACRSSIMIGKNLSQKQMTKVVRNMGTIDKPWNCPHGRPTMRHLMSLGQWNEYNEFDGDEESESEDRRSWTDTLDVWRDYLKEMGDGEDEDEDNVE
ncbi:Serinc-domain-containing protein [Aspergillus alliaceus]|uniref:Serinc-domain-containing protein n=1 Tax=Petromyces alliaceus TaxID=209559 RepID=UPI0012A40D2E|nr:Serinc-domain-containing protein [Aspergillus alliaceus]KAB8235510.1 Serinc-domain-containing protein [Aspergillus alliaceus]